ncbi:hypothetical protein EST38_g6336 [Candolleomyces aberdarensis]|uniref:Uncharacterized protein n=1 Tax=Candolleomyces aberdarensis TaxID=2316362 RepID=A0A4Q2DI21_9AGAR|nr:hypothetical protein EST38_g6336 [Candolleomyces aberdarensis]
MAKPMPRLFVFRHGWCSNCSSEVIPITLLSRRDGMVVEWNLFAKTEEPPHIVTEDVREWDYGDYEGLKTSEIHKNKPTWDIWKDGCPGGESVTEMEARVDSVIAKVQKLHKEYVEGKSEARDILIVAHGHFNRVLICRWLTFPLVLGTRFNVEPGSLSASQSVQDSDDLVSPVESPHGELDPAASLDAITSEQSEPADQNAEEAQSESGRLSLSDLQGDENTVPQGAAEPATAEDKPVRKVSATPSKKGPMPVNTNTAKANGGPPTPLVKKIINSGTFGAGNVKPPPPVKAAVSGSAVPTKPAAAASALRRSTTSAPTATSKPAMASKPPATSATATATRRASLVPAKPATSKGPLSSSVNAKPSAAADPAKARASVVSPTGSVVSAKSATSARPRASISEAVKKPAAPAKPTIATSRTATAAKAAPARTAITKPTTTARTAGKQSTPPSGSISSIKESKEDNKALEDLQGQLKEVEESLKAKTESVSALEVELEKLQGSFQTALDDVQSKTTLVTELEAAKATLESQLSEAQASLSGLQGGRDEEVNLLQSVKDQLEAAKTASQASASEVAALLAQIAELEATVAANERILEALQAEHSAVLGDASKASDVEREALFKTKADFEAISKEAEALKAAHAESLRAARATIEELETKVAELESLQSQVDELKAEKEENANKISELEVEVLEVKEQLEELEDTRDKLKATIAGLEADVAKSAQALEELKKSSDEKEADANARAEALKAEHAQELNEASERAAALQDTLRSLQEQLSAALAAQEQAAKDAAAAQASYEEETQKLEAAHAAKEEELNARIAAIQESLDNQEAIYNSKVQAVKDEHEVLRKEEFDRAKSEAGAAHAQELQALRAESGATIAQIQASNKTTMESLSGDHTAELESTVKDYTKQIGNLNLELKATKDDLAKSKAALDELRKELESVKGQRDAARASAAAGPTVSPQHVEEVARLTKELSVAKDDLSAVTDMLNLTKSSLTEMSEQHQKDSEEAARSRAEEALKATAAHDEEIKTLASQKSDLLIKLSDLEGELATVKAALSAAQTASPKANGSTAQPPASAGISKEEFAKLHEAHTHKIYDLQADHEKSLKALKEELDKSQEKAEQLGREVERKNMEIKYLEQDQEENQGEITRLTEIVSRLGGESDAA